jgi:hypothetical protein
VGPRIDGKDEGRLAAEQPPQRLRVDNVVDHGEEEAAFGRARTDEGGGAVSETKAAVLDEPKSEAALAHELAQALLLVADDDEDFLDPDRAQGANGPLEERDPRQTRERLRAGAQARARPGGEDDPDRQLELGRRHTHSYLLALAELLERRTRSCQAVDPGHS